MKKFSYSEQIKVDEVRKQITNLDTSFYNEKILLCLAIYKGEEGLKPSFIKVEFFEKNEELPSELEYNYEELIMIRKYISFSDLLDLLGRAEDGEEFKINSKSFVIHVQGSQISYVFSESHLMYTKSRYPMFCYNLKFTTETDGYLPNTPLTGIGCPPYPNSDKAITHLFNCIIPQYNHIERQFIIILPQFTARIKSVKLFDKKTEIQIDSKNLSLDKLQIQYYVTGNDYTITEPAKRIDSNSFIIETKSKPLMILVVLTDLSEKIIDKKEINTEFMFGDSNVEVDIPDYTLKEMILQGEGKNLEFKSQLKEPARFVRSVVAFANTKGGRIILGVNENNGHYISVTDPEKSKETIMNFIAQYCDPKIDVTFRYSEELKVLVIEIPEGNQKPYFLANEGIFVRHGATNRQITKSELEELQKNNSHDGDSSSFA